MSERFLFHLLREAPPPASVVRRRRYLLMLAVPVTLAAVFGVWAIVADGRWGTGVGFLVAALGIGWAFWSVK